MKLYQDKDFLYERYVKEKLTIPEISKLCNCSLSAISNNLKRNNIKIRTNAENVDLYSLKNKKLYRDRAWLKKRYQTEKCSAIEIRKEINCSPEVLNRWLNKFNIKIRTISEAQKAWHQKNPKKRTGSKAPYWKGGRYKKDGYVLVFMPEHPNSIDGYIAEHRLIMTKYLGRPLEKGEIVHHISGVRNDNKIENLELLIIKTHSRGYKNIYLKDINRLIQENKRLKEEILA